MRTTLGRSLTLMGYAVESAEDGRTALAMLRPEIDLALLDIRMPGMDGFETARHIRPSSTVSNVPIIVVAGEYGQDKVATGR